jgi:hypothetical protein
MKKNNIIICATALFIISGCAPIYVSKSNNQARISINYFWGYDNDELLTILKLENVNDKSCIQLSGLSTLATVNKGNPLARKTSNQENIIIDAEKPLKLRISLVPAASIGTMRYYQNCQRELTFTPKHNSNYELIVKSPPCDVEVREDGTKMNIDITPLPCL